MLSLSLDTWTEIATAWLANYLIHSTLLLAAAFGVHRWLRDRRPALQERLWRGALLAGFFTAALQLAFGGLLAPPVSFAPTATSPISGFSESTAVATSRDVFSPNATLSPALTAGVREPAASLAASPPLPAVTSGSGVAGRDASARLAGLSTASPASWLLALWGLGALLLLGRLALAYGRFLRLLRSRRTVEEEPLVAMLSGLCRRARLAGPVRLSASRYLPVPLARGLGRPEICLPERAVARLGAVDQEGILAHEVAHLVRRDPAWLLLYRAIEAAFFFQPLNRLARRRLQELAEYRCDDWAARTTGRRRALARTLTEVAGWLIGAGRNAPTLAMAPGMATRPSPLARRVERLLEAARPEESTPRWLAIALGLAIAVLLVVAPGISRAGGAEPPPAPEAAPAPPAPPSPEASPSSDASPILAAPTAPTAAALPTGEVPPLPEGAPLSAASPAPALPPTAPALPSPALALTPADSVAPSLPATPMPAPPVLADPAGAVEPRVWAPPSPRPDRAPRPDGPSVSHSLSGPLSGSVAPAPRPGGVPEPGPGPLPGGALAPRPLPEGAPLPGGAPLPEGASLPGGALAPRPLPDGLSAPLPRPDGPAEVLRFGPSPGPTSPARASAAAPTGEKLARIAEEMRRLAADRPVERREVERLLERAADLAYSARAITAEERESLRAAAVRQAAEASRSPETLIGMAERTEELARQLQAERAERLRQRGVRRLERERRGAYPPELEARAEALERHRAEDRRRAEERARELRERHEALREHHEARRDQLRAEAEARARELDERMAERGAELRRRAEARREETERTRRELHRRLQAEALSEAERREAMERIEHRVREREAELRRDFEREAERLHREQAQNRERLERELERRAVELRREAEAVEQRLEQEQRRLREDLRERELRDRALARELRERAERERARTEEEPPH